jgi:hypothetical protein
MNEAYKFVIPKPLTSEQVRKKMEGCLGREAEYWREMLRLTLEREGKTPQTPAKAD